MFEGRSFAENVRQLVPGWKDLLSLAGLALITGVFLAFPVLILALVLKVEGAWLLALVTLAVSQALVWVTLIRRWSGLISSLEDLLQIDIDQNGVIGGEDQTPGAVRVEVIEDQGRSGVYASLPATPDQLKTLARGILSDRKTLSDANWSGRGRPFDRSTWSRLKGELLARGLAAWNSPGCSARGLALTRSGQAVFRYFLTADAPTLPHQTDLDQG